jgi:hypothetical protein
MPLPEALQPLSEFRFTPVLFNLAQLSPQPFSFGFSLDEANFGNAVGQQLLPGLCLSISVGSRQQSRDPVCHRFR